MLPTFPVAIFKVDRMIENGTKSMVDGRMKVFYDGYWIQTYDAPADTLLAKKQLIGALTRRLFNHVEHGINIPGKRLKEARDAFEHESDPEYRRVKGAMLAGALFNRAMDIFTKLVELQEAGVEIELDNALMRECGRCLQEALTLGKLVLHRSGDEGIDELWGEPFRAFISPIDAFYEGRYIKIAQAMREIDLIAETLVATFAGSALFAGVEELICSFAEAARIKSETLRTDPNIFQVWSTLVVSAERLVAFKPLTYADPTDHEQQVLDQGKRLLMEGRDLIFWVTRARVPMPKSTQEFIDRAVEYRPRLLDLRPLARDLPRAA